MANPVGGWVYFRILPLDLEETRNLSLLCAPLNADRHAIAVLLCLFEFPQGRAYSTGITFTNFGR